jgi:hypothetical protein
VSDTATLAPDAAMALGIAATAMPFARTPAGEAERWLRVLRLHGEAGIALQALGVSEGPFETGDGEDPEGAPATSAAGGKRHEREPAAPVSATGDAERDAVALVSAQAVEIASRRGARGVGTKDLLLAVIRIYGEEFDRVLRAHGTDRAEVLARLALQP